MILERMDRNYMDNSMETISSMVVYRYHMKTCGLPIEAVLLQMTFAQLVEMEMIIIITANHNL